MRKNIVKDTVNENNIQYAFVNNLILSIHISLKIKSTIVDN